ncbi:MAG TPA: HD domain-containing protein [Salinimicrobium sp.]|nr:HD domain-containing protein [Salinimicrobium sp.]
MDKNTIIRNTETFVRDQLINAEGGHDWSHIIRVVNNAKKIAEKEHADGFVVELGALLHDIADSKFHNGNEEIGPEKAEEFLITQELPENIIRHVVNIIRSVSFKGGNIKQEFNSRELEIIQDADRLDALGAIGIARTFNYGGFKRRALYDPEISPKLNLTKEEYKNSTAPTINHFYEKLLLLKERMNTETGRKMAEERHEFLEKFLGQFFREWNGN